MSSFFHAEIASLLSVNPYVASLIGHRRVFCRGIACPCCLAGFQTRMAKVIQYATTDCKSLMKMLLATWLDLAWPALKTQKECSMPRY